MTVWMPLSHDQADHTASYPWVRAWSPAWSCYHDFVLRCSATLRQLNGTEDLRWRGEMSSSIKPSALLFTRGLVRLEKKRKKRNRKNISNKLRLHSNSCTITAPKPLLAKVCLSPHRVPSCGDINGCESEDALTAAPPCLQKHWARSLQILHRESPGIREFIISLKKSTVWQPHPVSTRGRVFF